MDEKQHQLWQQRINNEHKLRRKDHRDPFQRDRARILHSAAFRRLQAKTQVHGTGSNDFHRTRLTHSLEAAQIGSGILAQIENKQPELNPLLPSASLIESLCLAHDIGHPPFGHGGEVALNYAMRDHGGFEGNAQTFRIISQLEPYTKKHGMNLSRRTLLGLIKYPALLSSVRCKHLPDPVSHQRRLKAKNWVPAKGIYDCDKVDFDWVLAPLSEADKTLFMSINDHLTDPKRHNKTRYKSLDCSIMEIADDIAYGVHDLEDAIVLGKVTRQQWQDFAADELANCGDPWFEENIQDISEMLFSGEHYLRKDAIGAIVNTLLTSAHIQSQPNVTFENELLQYNAFLELNLAKALDVFKRFVSKYVIQIPEVQIIEYKGQQIIMDLFEALSADPERLLPEATKRKWLLSQKVITQQEHGQTEDEAGMRIISDYIAAMTDGYAQKLHQQLFSSAN
ncbi:anti-phage deoxyguanosine triphosphatase [Vibrio sp. MA40-2]|uniref:anti-phage deoxyguanosine triphosphatase n=1 Tax=Vibrio sp. MA40-2 TaxID=3391828 RepID=UPI0039A5829C